jgi:hypothetical protein
MQLSRKTGKLEAESVAALRDIFFFGFVSKRNRARAFKPFWEGVANAKIGAIGAQK